MFEHCTIAIARTSAPGPPHSVRCGNRQSFGFRKRDHSAARSGRRDSRGENLFGLSGNRRFPGNRGTAEGCSIQKKVKLERIGLESVETEEEQAIAAKVIEQITLQME